MNHSDTWMPLYIGDYLADTMELSGAQHGAYLLLLMYYWRNGPLPDDDAKLAAIGRTERRVWDRDVGPAVRAFFRVENGRLHQKRADLELAKAEAARARAEQTREAATERMRRWRNGGADPPDRGFRDASQSRHETVTRRERHGFPPDPLPVPSPSSSEEPPETPRLTAGGRATPWGEMSQDRVPKNARAFGTNPRAKGANPRAENTNPRAKYRNGFHALHHAAEGAYFAGQTIDAEPEPEPVAWLENQPRG